MDKQIREQKTTTQNRKEASARVINSPISVKSISGNYNLKGTDLNLFKIHLYFLKENAVPFILLQHHCFLGTRKHPITDTKLIGINCASLYRKTLECVPFRPGLP